MRNCTDKFNETPAERNSRIDAMLKCMVMETLIEAYRKNEPPKTYTRNQIADYVGCSKDHIRRIEQSALRKMRLHTPRR